MNHTAILLHGFSDELEKIAGSTARRAAIAGALSGALSGGTIGGSAGHAIGGELRRSKVTAFARDYEKKFPQNARAIASDPHLARKAKDLMLNEVGKGAGKGGRVGTGVGALGGAILGGIQGHHAGTAAEKIVRRRKAVMATGLGAAGVGAAGVAAGLHHILKKKPKKDK